MALRDWGGLLSRDSPNRGSSVAIFDLNEEAGDELVRDLGSQVMFCRVNVSDDDSVASGISAVMEKFGTIHISVNCAGRGGGATKTVSRKGAFPMELFRDGYQYQPDRHLQRFEPGR